MEKKINEKEFMELITATIDELNADATGGASVGLTLSGILFGIKLREKLFDNTEEITVVKEEE